MKMDHVRGFPGHLLRRAHQISSAIFAEELAGFEVTPVQAVALTAIAEYGQLDATRLSEIIDFDRATIGGVVERLERKGLIERTKSEADKRIKVLRPTPAGHALIEASEARINAVQKRIVAALTEQERDRLLALLGKVVGAGEVGPPY